MTFFNMTIFHIKRILKTPSLMAALVLVPVGTILFFSFIFSPKTEDKSSESIVRTVVLLGEGNEALKESLLELDYEDNIRNDRTRAFQDLERGKVGVIYEIPDNYIERLESGNKVTIKATNRTKNSRSSLFEYELQHLTREMLLRQALATNTSATADFNYHNHIKITNLENAESFVSGTMMLLAMTVLYIFTTCLSIAGDLVTFKKNNTLRRAVLSPNSSVSIMGSHLAAAVLFLVITNLGILGYIHSQNPLSNEMLLRMGLLLVLSILLGLSSCLVMFRIFKEPAVVSNVGMLVFMILVGISFLENLKLHPMLSNLSYLSPFKWLLDILEKGINPAAVTILVLTVAVLMTAGSYKLENYVQR